MAIEDRNLKVGTRLVATYKKHAYVCTVEAGEGGEGVAFVLEDGTRFKSPSAVASSVMGGKAVNGWRFWTVEGEQPQPTADAGEQPTKKGKSASGAGRSKKAATAATPPPGYDYLIDADGRPLPQAETPAEGETEPRVVAAE